MVEARDGDAVVGRLHARRPHSALLVLDRVESEAGRDVETVCAAFAAAISEDLATPGREVLVVGRAELAPIEREVQRQGLVAARRKCFVSRDLRAPLPPVAEGLRLTSLADAGEAAFLRRMVTASEGDPFEERQGAVRDPDREWRELVESAGKRLDPTRWFLVDDASGAVGVVLPQAIRPELGTLYYIAVEPVRRGRGLGRAVHAEGLSLLARYGQVRYVGSTDLRNEAMRRIFAANGCPEEGTETYYVRPAAR